MRHTRSRRRFLSTGAIGLAAPAGMLLPATVWGQSAADYPSRPIQLIVPLGAGGVADTGARIVARRLGEVLGVSVVVENRPGGAQAVGIGQAARATPDGYTLLWSTGGFAAAPVLMKAFEFDPIRDFQPITMAATSNNVLVGANSLPGGTLKDLIDHSKRNPGKVFYGTASGGTTLVFEHLKMVTGAQLEAVQYKGSPAVWTDLVGGRIHAMLDGPGLTKGFIEKGQARALGMFGPRRSSVLPDVPTIAEQGFPDFSVLTWIGLWAPKGTPAPIVQRLEQAMARVMAMPETPQELGRAGLDATSMTSAEFTEAIRKELQLWKTVAARAGIAPE
jgi:tripartite-type tricarboxylate transporter receptor subunit TctC